MCGVLQGSVLELLLCLIYVYDMPHGVNLNLFLYAGNSCLMFQHKDVEEIEKVLNNDFENDCIFASQCKFKNIKKLSQVTYLGRVMDENISAEAMALKVIKKVNGNLKFLYRKD